MRSHSQRRGPRSGSYLEGAASAAGEAAAACWEPTETYLASGGGPPRLPAPAVTPPGRHHLEDTAERNGREVSRVGLRCAEPPGAGGLPGEPKCPPGCRLGGQDPAPAGSTRGTSTRLVQMGETPKM